jgi:hypothetical protein
MRYLKNVLKTECRMQFKSSSLSMNYSVALCLALAFMVIWQFLAHRTLSWNNMYNIAHLNLIASETKKSLKLFSEKCVNWSDNALTYINFFSVRILWRCRRTRTNENSTGSGLDVARRVPDTRGLQWWRVLLRRIYGR